MIELQEEDLQIEVIYPPSLGGQHVGVPEATVRVTHTPTEIYAESSDERSQLQNKVKALEELRKKLDFKHGYSGYTNHSCRCLICKNANRLYSQKSRIRRSALPPDKIPHGLNGYQNYGCRCDICSEASSLDASHRKALKQETATISENLGKTNDQEPS